TAQRDFAHPYDTVVFTRDRLIALAPARIPVAAGPLIARAHATVARECGLALIERVETTVRAATAAAAVIRAPAATSILGAGTDARLEKSRKRDGHDC